MCVKGGIVRVSYILLAATLTPRGKVNIVLSTTGSRIFQHARRPTIALSTSISLIASMVLIVYASNIEYANSIEYVGQQYCVHTNSIGYT